MCARDRDSELRMLGERSRRPPCHSDTCTFDTAGKPRRAVKRFFSERSLYAIARPSVCRLSYVTFVRPTQAVQLFGNISTAFGTLAIH